MDASLSRSILRRGSGRRHAGPPLWLVATTYTFLFLAGLYPVTIFGGSRTSPGLGSPPRRSRRSSRRVRTLFGSARSAVRRGDSVGDFRRVSRQSSSVSWRARGRCLHCALRRHRDRRHDDCGVVCALGDGPTGRRAGPRRTSGTLLARSGVRRRRLRRSVRAPGRGHHDSGGVHEAHSEMDRRVGDCDCDLRRTELVYLMIPGALPLVPLARFPGFVWLIAIGFALPTSVSNAR